MNQTARVRIDKVLSKKFEIGRGQRQGRPLSALLYILCDEAMIKKTVDGEELGIKVGEKSLLSVVVLVDKDGGLKDMKLDDILFDTLAITTL